MNVKIIFTLCLLAGSLLLASCARGEPSPTAEANLPNPASVYCEENGGKIEMRQDASGGVAGVCVFPDGSVCDEWAYYRKECQLGDSLVKPAETDAQAGANLPNPASVYCEENGGKIEMRQDTSGGVAGVCVFPDGSECAEWAYYRKECQPGQTPVKPVVTEAPLVTEPSPISRVEVAEDGCKIYRDEEHGFSFHYPAGTKIIVNDDPTKSISIVPDNEAEGWPSITISHPSDREEFRPPQGVDLLQWLTDHYLLGEKRMDDKQIAGTTAIHFRHERSPQSYADDRYYFARDGQLYMVLIGHADDKEDWEFYNHFLGSIQFDQ